MHGRIGGELVIFLPEQLGITLKTHGLKKKHGGGTHLQGTLTKYILLRNATPPVAMLKGRDLSSF